MVFTPLGPKRLRGISEPIACYSALPLPLKKRTFKTEDSSTSVLQWADDEVARRKEVWP